MTRRAAAAAAVLATVAALTGTPVAQAQDMPNYTWRTDPVSKTLAGKPFADRVLHRVPTSLHDAPQVPPEAAAAAARGTALYGPSAPIYVGTGEAQVMCTVAVAGYDDTGRKVAVTAGHCANVGDPVTAADAPGLGPTGRIVYVDRNLDYAVIHLNPSTEVSRSYGGITINHVGSAPLRPGQPVCKRGVASGYTCGITWHDWDSMNINQVCAMQGDSGAPLFVGDRLVGMVNGGMFRAPFSVACHSPLQGPLHAPTGSARADAIFPSLPGGFRLP